MPSPQGAPSPATTEVWDLPLRLFHWLLVLAVAGSWLTTELGAEGFSWHEWFGYATLVLVLFRIAWGIVGPRHARFASFVHGFAAIRRYAGSLLRADAQHFAGHNPLGALMVIVLLALIGVIAVTGLFANDEIFTTGPLYGYVSDDTSDVLSRLHRRLCDVLWIAIGLHLAAILLYWWLKGENLVLPMITGRKPGAIVPPAQAIAGSRNWLALFIVALAIALLYVVVTTAPEPSPWLF